MVRVEYIDLVSRLLFVAVIVTNSRAICLVYIDRASLAFAGIDERDCALDTREFSGNGPRPSKRWSDANWLYPGSNSYPADQTFAARPFLEQNSPDYIRQNHLDQLNQKGQDVRGWFNWNLKNPDRYDDDEYKQRYQEFLDIPQHGYDDCENDPNCEVFSQQSDVKDGHVQQKNALQDWDVQCFGSLADRCPINSDGTVAYFANAAESTNCQGADTFTYADGGQAYIRACRYGTENLLLKCLPPATERGATEGVKQVCGCSADSNQYVRDGFADLCNHAEDALPGKYEGLTCKEQNQEGGNFRPPGDDGTTLDAIVEDISGNANGNSATADMINSIPGTFCTLFNIILGTL